MKEPPIFSIIVTVYNVSDYLEECLNSVERQTIKQYELIVVDDGSTDCSGKIIDLYSTKHSNVRVIHQRNQGLSAARNMGLKYAKGEYILFLDGDDYIHPETLKMFLEYIDKSHPEIIATYKNYVVEFNKAICVEPHVCIDESLISGTLSGIEYLNCAMRLNAYQACAQYYVYQKLFLDKIKVQFEKDIFHEDELWSLQVLPQAIRVAVNKVPFYYHQIIRDKNSRDLIHVCHELDQSLPRTLDYVWIRDHIATLYMNATYMGGIGILKDEKLNRKFPLVNAHTSKNCIKAIIYLISPYMYVRLDSFIKRPGRRSI